MPGGGKPLRVVLGQLPDQPLQRHRLQPQAGVLGFEARQGQQVLQDDMEPVGMALDGAQKPVPVGLGQLPVVIDQSLDIALDDRQRRAQLVRDVGDEIPPQRLQIPLTGDVVQHAQHPLFPRVVPGGDEGAGGLDPDRRGLAGELELDPRAGRPLANALQEGRKTAAVHHRLDALAQDHRGVRENLRQGAVDQDDAIGAVDDEDPLAQAAQRGLDLAELPAPLHVGGMQVGHQFVDRGDQIPPPPVEETERQLDQVGFALPDGRLEIAQSPALDPQEPEQQEDDGAQQKGDQHVSLRWSTMRYPTPRMVSIKSASTPSFSRSRRTCVSTVRVSISVS